MQIVILGGGIAGLSLAYFLRKAQPAAEIMLLEGSNRAGGKVESLYRNDFLLEQGPRGIRPDGTATLLQMVEELGLAGDLLSADKGIATRYLWHQGKLFKAPFGLFCRYPFKALRALWKEGRAPPENDSDASVAAFFSKRIGHFWTENLIEPAFTGIWAGDIDTLSMAAILPSLWEKGKRGSLLKRGSAKKRTHSPYGALISFKGGLQRLTDALVHSLGPILRLEEPVTALKGKKVTTTKGSYTPDLLFSTLPLKSIAALLQLPLLCPTSSIDLVYACFNQKPAMPTGFGYLVPRNAGEKILGVTFDHQIFPQNYQEKGCLTVMLGGMRDRELFQAPIENSLAIAEETLYRHLHLKPDHLFAHRVPSALPHYQVGYLEAAEAFCRNNPEVHWLGTGFGALSLTQILNKSSGTARHFSLQ